MKLKQTIKLSKPIQAQGETLDELKIREPVGADIRACGMPMAFIALADNPNQQRIEMNTAAIAQYISRLCDIPPSSVDQLALSDFARLMEIVSGFFEVAPQV